jgi:putative salt-induced outer membrane protein YdiY
MTQTLRAGGAVILLLGLGPATALAQDPPVAPDVIAAPTWTATVGGGLALTSGNTDSLSYNFAFDLAHDTKTGNLLRWTGLYLRGTQNDILVVNRLSLGLRDEYTFSPRVFAFGRIDYLHDTFKRIDYFIAPAVGLGYKIVDNPNTRFSIDLGGGSVTERNIGNDQATTGAIQASESLQHQLSPSATLKHAITTVWNTNDFDSGLITASVGLATRISSRFQLTVDLIDTFKTRPPTAATESNDINIVIAITAKY